MSPRAWPPPDSCQASWANWLLGTPGLMVALAWGLAESTLFFIVPDLFLPYVAILRWRRTWTHLIASVVGALLGGALLFPGSTVSHREAQGVLARVPFVRAAMFRNVDQSFQAHGLLAVFLGSVSGIPYQRYAVEAPKFCRERDFLLATPPVRLVRFMLVGAGFWRCRWLAPAKDGVGALEMHDGARRNLDGLLGRLLGNNSASVRSCGAGELNSPCPASTI